MYLTAFRVQQGAGCTPDELEIKLMLAVRAGDAAGSRPLALQLQLLLGQPALARCHVALQPLQEAGRAAVAAVRPVGAL